MLLFFLKTAATHIFYLALHLESGSFPRPLPQKAEAEAFGRLKAGDRDARDLLIRHNLRLVAHVAKKYYAGPDAQDDLISIGTIGLIKAVDSFCIERGVRFASYASQCIENELRMHLRRIRRAGAPVSLQEPLETTADNTALTLVDVLPDDAVMESGIEQREILARLRTAVKALPPREREIVSLRFGLAGKPPITQQQVAARLGISRSYVSRLEAHVLAKLRQSLGGG